MTSSAIALLTGPSLLLSDLKLTAFCPLDENLCLFTLDADEYVIIFVFALSLKSYTGGSLTGAYCNPPNFLAFVYYASYNL
jgi:hypothetical protein